MLRQLLTILALVTGFAAVAEPARASEAAAAVEAVGAAEAELACAPAHPVLYLSNAAAGPREARNGRCRPAIRPVIVPAVQLQADRARE